MSKLKCFSRVGISPVKDGWSLRYESSGKFQGYSWWRPHERTHPQKVATSNELIRLDYLENNKQWKLSEAKDNISIILFLCHDSFQKLLRRFDFLIAVLLFFFCIFKVVMLMLSFCASEVYIFTLCHDYMLDGSTSMWCTFQPPNPWQPLLATTPEREATFWKQPDRKSRL